MNRNVILQTQFSQFWYAFISRISFTWNYMLCHGFSFFWSWKSQGKSMLKKRGHP